ncbi:MAG: hypothetical protein SFU99_14590 [Saprospiraceae bacterium]|nr:hypothetical protein [Saprospiraceae bacterium]
MKTLFITLSVILFTNILFDKPFQIPKGTAPRLDGVFTAGEWSDALEQDLVNGGKVYLKHDTENLYVGVRGNTGKQGWAHVYVPVNEQIMIFHASAALGTAIYNKDATDVWQAQQEFTWAVRDTSFSQKAVNERQTFYEKTNWVANTCNMGEKQFLEFKINRKYLAPKQIHIAVMFASNAKEPHFFPGTLKDDCLAEQLIYGSTPKDLKFDQSQWCNIKFSKK